MVHFPANHVWWNQRVYHHFPMVFPGFPHFSMVFLWFSHEKPQTSSLKNIPFHLHIPESSSLAEAMAARASRSGKKHQHAAKMVAFHGLTIWFHGILDSFSVEWMDLNDDFMVNEREFNGICYNQFMCFNLYKNMRFCGDFDSISYGWDSMYG